MTLLDKLQTSQNPIRGEVIPVTNDLIARFIAHAQTAPDKIAILTSETALTYQQLYLEVLHWKALLSPHTQTKAILCLERNPQMLAILLAMQWLDITYIPIDPSIPIARLSEILMDSQAQAIIYDASTHPHFGKLSCAVLLNIANRASKPQNETIEPYVPKQSGTAYIIYTSGSTGKPKGVAIPRLAFHNFLTSMSHHFLLEDQAITLAIATISFDMSVLDLYLPIWQQKTVFIASQTQHKDPLSLEAILNHYPITFIQTTPSFWSLLLNLKWRPQPNLVALCGGEPLTSNLAQRILEKTSALWNMYGPTEATVYCAIKKILPNMPITTGHPIHNMEMCVMDAEQRILPPNVKGELFIGGIGLAEGYVNNPELTNKKFISYTNSAFGRLYQVGDMACATDEGEFIIFGRIDHQIKLHGYRIELEEIEARIQTFPGIHESAVTVYQEQLVAYVCCTDQENFSKSNLMQHLAKQLPDYMLPTHCILLDRLPRTLSEKINRKALPPPMLAVSTQAETSQLTPTQLILTRIWSEELGKTVTIHDDFFTLGGHSLLAARIIIKIAQQLGKKTNLPDLYHAPTIDQFDKIVEQAPPAESLVTANTPTPSDSPSLPLHDFQLLLWLSKFGGPKVSANNIVWRKRVQGPLDNAALDLALQWVLEKQEVFSYHIHTLYPLQKPCTQPAKQFRQWRKTSLTHLTEEESEVFLAQHFDDLFYRKIWRFKSIWISAELYYLQHDQIEFQVCFSHLLADESCASIFFETLSQAYLYFTKRTHAHSDHAMQPYTKYIIQHNTTLRKQADTAAKFWADYLKDTGSFHFPKQYVIPHKEAASTQVELPSSFLIKLRQFCARQSVAINDVLCAAVSLALLQCCDNDLNCVPHKIVIFTTKSTREDPEYDNTIGCFLRIDPIKLELNNQSTLTDLSKQAQQSAMVGSPYQHASSLVKFAAVGKIQLCLSRNPIKRFVINMALRLLAKYFPELKLDHSLFHACEIIAVMDQTKQFLMNVNMPRDFLDEKRETAQTSLFGAPEAPIPYHPFRNTLVKYMLDVYFHRDSMNKHYIVITSNHTPDFQKRLGETVASIIDSCPT